jgi:hypothetical protein
MLKPQDIVILLKILSMQQSDLLSQNQLALFLCMSASEVNAGIKRLVTSSLLSQRWAKMPILLPVKAACQECLIHGVKYFFPAKLGEFTRGIATSYAAPILAKHIISGHDPIPIWPYAEGDQKGMALEPLYRSVPESIAKYPDELFYEYLILIDAIRSGRARERKIAIDILKEKLNDK